jgi:hypothetical protein
MKVFVISAICALFSVSAFANQSVEFHNMWSMGKGTSGEFHAISQYQDEKGQTKQIQLVVACDEGLDPITLRAWGDSVRGWRMSKFLARATSSDVANCAAIITTLRKMAKNWDGTSFTLDVDFEQAQIESIVLSGK